MEEAFIDMKLRTGIREPRIGNRELATKIPRTGNRESGIGNRKQGTGDQEPGTGN